MTNGDLAKSLQKQAEIRLVAAQMGIDRENWAFAVRQSQEAVELSLKASLNFVGIDPPKWHDVSQIIKDNASKFPLWKTEIIDVICSVSRRLRHEREASMYGENDTSTPPDRLYSKLDAETALGDAKKVYDYAKQIIN